MSITNCDCKIIAFKYLLEGCKKDIDKFISKNMIYWQQCQTHFRYIWYCENTNTDGILLFADFQKAFDSVEWNFQFKSFKSLENFNFGENFMKWIKSLYTNPYFHIKNNGWISQKCKMLRGIRQGCPVSAILFLFVMEILNEKINSTNPIFKRL